MNFSDTIPWDIIDAPFKDDFFGDEAKRVNLIRHGIKNGIITQSRVLAELKELDPESFLTTGKYTAQVKKKIQWIEEYYFPKCMKEIKWFEQRWGGDVRNVLQLAREAFANQPTNVFSNDKASKLKDKLGKYPAGLQEL